MKYGEVIYWSGKRDDVQLQQIAVERTKRAKSMAMR
jgi:hypothetical protein